MLLDKVVATNRIGAALCLRLKSRLKAQVY